MVFLRELQMFYEDGSSARLPELAVQVWRLCCVGAQVSSERDTGIAIVLLAEQARRELAGTRIACRSPSPSESELRGELPATRSVRRRLGVSGTCQQLWDTRELHLVSLDYGGETREVGAIDVNIDQDLVA